MNTQMGNEEVSSAGQDHQQNHQSEPQPQGDVIRIKKYGNRRLYSTSEKRYVTLPDIERLIKNGERLEVIEAQTGREITSEILMQILLERGKAQYLPVDFLEQMIRWSEVTVQSFFQKSMMQGFEWMHKMQTNNPLSQFMLNPTQIFQSRFQKPDNSDEIQYMRDRLEELERELRRTKGQS